MKRFALPALIVTVALVGFAAQAAQAQVAVKVTIGEFYNELAPYGQWVDCSYGQCWVPARRIGSRTATASGSTRPTDGHGFQ